MRDDGECFDGHSGEGPGGRQVLPAGLADLPAGPRLAVLVASVDRRVCNGFELEESIKARRRLICWLEAECLSDVNELTHTSPGMPDEPAERCAELDSMTQSVLEPLLGWTGHHADWYLSLATTLPRLPQVRDTLASGGLELGDMRTIVDRITDAKPDLWGAIEDAIFPKVLELRGGLLRSKVEAEVLKADPEAAVKRHRAARTGRNVAIWPAVDGVADLAVRGLSADQAAEAYGNIDAIARAVKATGDTRPLSHLRADVAAALLTGTADITDCSAPTQADPDGTERGGQGHCAVHRFPDHDLHDSWCECGDCSLAPVTSCRVCGAAAKNGVPIHNTAAHSAAQNAAECGTAGGDAAGDNQTEGNAAVENAAAHAGASTSPPWSSSQPSWGAIRTRSKIEATSGVRGPRAGGPRRRATWTTTPNMPAVVQVRWTTSRRCARATTRRRVNGTGHSNRPDPANTLSPTPTAANTAARHHPSPPPVTAQPASATTSTAETDDRPPFRNPISRVGRCRDELKSATP